MCPWQCACYVGEVWGQLCKIMEDIMPITIILSTDKICRLPDLKRYGDSLSSGWRNIMDIVMRLHKLGLLPASVAALEGEDPAEAAARLPRLIAQRSMPSAPSFISRAFSRCCGRAVLIFRLSLILEY